MQPLTWNRASPLTYRGDAYSLLLPELAFPCWSFSCTLLQPAHRRAANAACSPVLAHRQQESQRCWGLKGHKEEGWVEAEGKSVEGDERCVPTCYARFQSLTWGGKWCLFVTGTSLYIERKLCKSSMWCNQGLVTQEAATSQFSWLYSSPCIFWKLAVVQLAVGRGEERNCGLLETQVPWTAVMPLLVCGNLLSLCNPIMCLSPHGLIFRSYRHS